jgi:ferredoxin--NADP+ reductase
VRTSCRRYRSLPLPDVPFDDDRGTVRNVLGRVIDDNGTVAAGEYVAGWLKRGPTGVIGTNKSDATETVRSLLDDLAAGRIDCSTSARDDVLRSLCAAYVDYDGWLKIDTAEIARGTAEGRGRVKIGDWKTLRSVAECR